MTSKIKQPPPNDNAILTFCSQGLGVVFGQHKDIVSFLREGTAELGGMTNAILTRLGFSLGGQVKTLQFNFFGSTSPLEKDVARAPEPASPR
jgi:hypothetical protein